MAKRIRTLAAGLVLLAASRPAVAAPPQEIGSRVRACGQVTMVSCDEAGAVKWLIDLGAPDVLMVSTDSVPDRPAVRDLARRHGFGRLCVSGRLVRRSGPFELALVEVDTLSEIQPEGEPVPDPLGPDVARVCDPGVRAPTVVKDRRPSYPLRAQSKRIEGTVWIEAVVDTDGKVSKTRVIRSRDRRDGLDEEALATASKWQFNPGTKDGKPVPMAVIMEITFTIEKRPGADGSPPRD